MRNVARPLTIPLKIWLAYQVREMERGGEGAREQWSEGARERGIEEQESDEQVSEGAGQGRR